MGVYWEISLIIQLYNFSTIASACVAHNEWIKLSSMLYLQSSFFPLLSTVYPSSQDRHNPPLYPVIYTSIPEAFRTIAERNWICIQLVVPTAIIWNKNASNVAAVDPKSSRFSQISMAAMSKWCLDLKEDRQSSFPHIRRAFHKRGKKISPLNGNLFLSLLTSLVQEQEKTQYRVYLKINHGSTRPDALSERLSPLAHCVWLQ